MGNKRLQLFFAYSLSLITVISIFSIAIYYSVSYSEEDRVENTMKTSLMHMLETDGYSAKTLDEIQVFAAENRIYYALWLKGDQEPFRKNGATLTWARPNNYLKLERIWVQQALTGMEKRIVSFFSYATPITLDGKDAELQILMPMEESNAMFSSLTNVLFFGSMMVSGIGIVLGLMLAYVNMLPIIRSWHQQRMFVADASHELRTPLSIMTLKTDRLMQNPSETIYDHIEDVAVIQKECRRMHRMVDDLLFLAKSDSGVIELNIGEFSVLQLSKDLQMLYGEFFEISEKSFIFDIQYAEYAVGDYEKIKQVCMIIIDNALRFTSEGNYVKLSIRQRAGRISFDIANNGIPLRSDEIPHIFDRFYKSDSSRNKNSSTEGNGLGLSIAQQIIHSHGGRIRVSVQNEVTTFNFTLAKARDKKATNNIDRLKRTDKKVK